MATLKRATTLKKEEVKKVTSMFSEKDIKSFGQQYAELSKQIKELEEKKKQLADKIKEGAENFGVKDDKGSYYIESENLIMGKVAKKSFKINTEEAIKVLESVGVGDVIDEVISQVVNEDKLQKAVQEGRLTLDTVESFTNVTTSYSVLVKEKEDMPEIEQTSLKSVAKKK